VAAEPKLFPAKVGMQEDSSVFSKEGERFAEA